MDYKIIEQIEKNFPRLKALWIGIIAIIIISLTLNNLLIEPIPKFFIRLVIYLTYTYLGTYMAI